MNRGNVKWMFDPIQRRQQLASKSARGGLVTLSAQALMFGLQLAGTVILARLLTPADFGLISMVAVVVGLGQLMREAGLPTATIQQETISAAQVSTLFWANALTSGVLSVLLIAFAPLIAAFYHEPELAGVTVGLAAAFGIGGLASQHLALLQRNLRFKSVAATQILSQVTYLVTGTAMALAGYRYWALVGGSIVQSVALVTVAFSLCRWMPGRPRRGIGAGRMIRFGGHILGFDLVNYFSRNLDNILIGRFLGANLLGLYAKAYSLFMIPITQIRAPVLQVAMPVLSTLGREPVRFRRYYRHMLGMLAYMTVPVTLYCIFEAPFLIGVLLGPQWLEAVPVFRILAVSALIQPVASTRGLVMLSRGLSKRYFRFGVVNAALTSASFVIGLPFGIEGVATAYAVANYVILVPSLYYCFGGTPVSPGDFAKAVAAPLAVGSAASLVFLAGFAGLAYSTIGNVLMSGAFALVYMLLAWTIPSFRDMSRSLLRALRESGDGTPQEP